MRRCLFEQACDAEKSAISHHSHNFQRVSNIAQRIAIHKNEVSDRADTNAPDEGVYTEGGCRIHTGGTQDLGRFQSASCSGEILCVQSEARRQTIVATAKYQRTRIELGAGGVPKRRAGGRL